MGKLIDLTGQRFGRLVVLYRAENDNQNRPKWMCRCNCGAEKVFKGVLLRNSKSRSCGCLRRETAAITCKILGKSGISNYKHGLCGTKEYNAARASKHRAMVLFKTPILTENEKAKVELYYKVSQILGEYWHVDHIIPLSKGGLHHPDNLQVVTKEYNLQKSDKLNFRAPMTLEVWRI